jgi:hypothetical protein
VTVRLRLKTLVPAEVFPRGPQREDDDGVRATDPQDRRYAPDLDPPPIDFFLPPLPSPVTPWDHRGSLGPGVHVFDRIEVPEQSSLEIRAEGSVDIYVTGFVSVGHEAELRCVGPGPVRFFVYGERLDPHGQALYLGNQAKVHAAGRTVWTINGGVLLDQEARFAQGSRDASATLNIRGSLLMGGRAVLGSEADDEEAPKVLVVLQPSGTLSSVELEQQAKLYAMIYAPDADVGMERQSLLAGALVCRRLALAGQTRYRWKDAVRGLSDHSAWELLAGWWEVEEHTWSAR